MAVETADLVVIGAGFFGIQVTKIYIQLHPAEKIVVLDANVSIGGTWSRERIWPGLRTNNLVGHIEYPDAPLSAEAGFDVTPGEHIRGEVFGEYFERYAEQHGVTERTRFRTKVESVEHQPRKISEKTSPDADGGWLLHYRQDDTSNAILARRLIIATGHTTEPLIPCLPGHDVFVKSTPLFHSKDWPSHRAALCQPDSHVAVMGAAKSAWDICYHVASAGGQAHMIVRKSGHGPQWMSLPLVTPLRLPLETLVVRRIISWFSPCIWGDSDGYGLVRWFLQRTWLGQRVTSMFWRTVQQDMVDTNGFESDERVGKLRPWWDFVWSGTACSILNYETDFFNFVKDGSIQVHIADVDTLGEDGEIALSDGTKLQVDALACATSWKDRPAVKFVQEELAAEVGLPHHAEDSVYGGRFAKADTEIFERFPMLAPEKQPVINKTLTELPTDPDDPYNPQKYNMPYLLYKFMVPPAFIHERSIAFAGVPVCFNGSLTSTAQGLWISAFFDGHIQVDQSEAVKETVLHARYARWRNPAGYGAKFPDWIFETMPYLDMLYAQIGLKGYRKRGWRDIFEPYLPNVFRGMVDEYAERFGVTSKTGIL